MVLTLSLSSELTEVMFHAGLHRSLVQMRRKSAERDSTLAKYRSECAWRLGIWDENLDQRRKDKSFEQEHSLAVKHLLRKDLVPFKECVDNARLAVCEKLLRESTESSRAVYDKIRDLRLLNELEQLSQNSKMDFSEHDQIQQAGFSMQEPILLQRAIVSGDVSQALVYLDKCSSNGKLQLAFNALQNLRNNQKTKPNEMLNLTLENREAILLWRSNEKNAAEVVMKNLCDKLQPSESEQLKR
jgi:ribosomal protein L22